MASRASTAGDKRRLFEREALPHLNALYTAALRLTRNPDSADDLLQEALLRGYRFFHQFSPGTNCRAWLLTILYNVFRNGYRRGEREQLASSPEDFEHRIEAESLNSGHASINPETLLMDSVLDHDVAEALDALPVEFRTVLLMVDVEELSYEETAQVLELPIGTVKSRLSRGRAAMRSRLFEFVQTHRPRKPMTGG